MRLPMLAAALLVVVISSCDNSQMPTQTTESHPSAAGRTISAKYSDTGTFLNECCDEDVFFEVDAHVTIKEDTSDEGVITWRLKQNTAKFVLTGLKTGLKYVCTQLDDQDVITYPGGCPWSNTLVERFRATATGTGQGKNNCSFVIKFTWNWRTDDDCNIVYDETLETECED